MWLASVVFSFPEALALVSPAAADDDVPECDYVEDDMGGQHIC